MHIHKYSPLFLAEYMHFLKNMKKKKTMNFYCSLIPTQFHRIHSHLPFFVNSFPGNKKPGSHYQHDICLNDVSPLSIHLA